MTQSLGLRLNLLGELTIWIGQEIVNDLPTRKAEALLLYLVCDPHPHRREVLSELLWNDLAAERGLGNLRLLLNQLRPRFARFLAITRYTVAIREDTSYWLDVDVLKHGLAGTIADIEQALQLYRGAFLHGFSLRDAHGFSEWQQGQAEYWQSQVVRGIRRLIEHYTCWNNSVQGLVWTNRLLSIEPLDEVAHRQTMLFFARSGQRQAAIHHYQVCVSLLHDQLHCEPEPATTALYQRILDGQERRSHMLPAQRGPLIGRAEECARIYEWLAIHATRLLTIVGPGGCGKTTLAISAGWRVVTEFLGPCMHGVFYLALVEYRTNLHVDDDDLLMEMAHVFGVKLAARTPIIDQIGRYLADQELLVIIDNGELLTRKARLVLSSLLMQAQALRILVTSRERLKLTNEHILAVDGLAYPKHAWLLDQIDVPYVPAQYAAVQLLLHHAHRTGTQAKATYNAADQRALVQICQLVDGLPLAIELAAPWLALRSPEELLASISETIDTLQRDAPDLPERHQSIRAVFEYSWRLLSDVEARALAGLSLFPASFTAKAAQAITGTNLSVLAALHDKSLLQVQHVKPETRYMLHPLLQQFALEKLQADAGTEPTGRAYHAHYFASFAQEHESMLYGPDGTAAMNAIERELENLRAGWYWATAVGDLTILKHYSICLHDFCVIRGWKLESQRLFAAGATAARKWLAYAATDAHTTLAAVRVLSCYAELEQTLGHIATAEQAYHDCRIMLHAIAAEDTPELLFVYKQLGLLAYGHGDYREAMQYLRLTLAIAEEGDGQVRIADTLLSMGAVALAEGDYRTAQQAFQRGFDIYKILQHDWGMSHTLRFLGVLALSANDPEVADERLHASLTIAQQTQNRIGEALTLDQLGVLYLSKGQVAQSTMALSQAYAIFAELGVELGIGRVLEHQGLVALAQGLIDQAAQHFLRVIAIGERIPSPPLLIESVAAALQVCITRGTNSDALLLITESLQRHPACTAETRKQLAAFGVPESKQTTFQQQVSMLSLDEIVLTIQAMLADIGYIRVVNG